MDRQEKLILKKLMESGKFLSKFAENSGHVYWISSPDFQKIQYISPAYEVIWGRSRQELYNDPEKWITYLHPDDANNHHPIHEMADRIKKEGDTARYIETYRIIRPEGQIRWILDRGFPVLDENGICYGVTGIAVDITEEKNREIELKKAKEEAEKANLAKTEFLKNMRHDIRTPLTGIVGFAEILKLESKEPRIKEYSDNLVASSHALLNLMDEVLEAIRVSTGDIPMLKRKFNLKTTFQQVIDLCIAKASEKKLNLSLSIENNLPNFVIGDKIRLHRIALELVGNALNFTDAGYVTLGVSLAKKDNRHLVIKMSVKDSGIGIPKEKQQEIYVQFKRLTPSYQGIYKGAGLGLYVVKQFIEELEGEIYVESEPLKGTIFTCLIPFQESLLDNEIGMDNEDKLHGEKSYFDPLSNLHPSMNPESKTMCSVLVVEDNFIAQRVAKTILNSLNCFVDLAANGEEAINFYKKNQYDLVFMDIGLGEGINGYEVTNFIRSQIKNQHTPIIALTAHAADESKQHCIEAGMNAVLTKPLTFAHASNILKSFIHAPQKSLEKLTEIMHELPDAKRDLFNLSHLALFDSEDALKNCGNTKMLRELMSLMSKELPNDLKCMKKAFNAHDFNLVEKTAHKIKSGAIYLGTSRMKYACQYLERYWKSGKRELFEALYNQAVIIVEETLNSINEWLGK
jgi:PAS domain S-box-containing protein